MADTFTDLKRKLGKLMDIGDNKELENATLAVAREMRGLMKSKINVKTGNLRNSVVARKFRTKGAGYAYVAVNRRKAPHAHLVEFGHGGSHPAPPHPYFRPVYDEYKANGRYEAALQTAISNAIKKAIK